MSFVSQRTQDFEKLYDLSFEADSYRKPLQHVRERFSIMRQHGMKASETLATVELYEKNIKELEEEMNQILTKYQS